MQRWIVVASAIVFCLLLGGGAFGYWSYKQSRPDYSYIPLPFNPDATEEQREQTVKEMKEKLVTDTILAGVVRDCDIEQKWKLPSEEAAVAEIKRRMIFEAGETNVKGVPMATLNIGFRGKVSEHDDLSALAQRMMADVQRLVAPKSGENDSMPTSY